MSLLAGSHTSAINVPSLEHLSTPFTITRYTKHWKGQTSRNANMKNYHCQYIGLLPTCDLCATLYISGKFETFSPSLLRLTINNQLLAILSNFDTNLCEFTTFWIQIFQFCPKFVWNFTCRLNQPGHQKVYGTRVGLFEWGWLSKYNSQCTQQLAEACICPVICSYIVNIIPIAITS